MDRIFEGEVANYRLARRHTRVVDLFVDRRDS